MRRIVFFGEGNSLRREIQSQDLPRRLSKHGSAVSRAAAEIQCITSFDQWTGKVVAAEMLVEEVWLDLAWHHALAGEFH